MEAEAKEARLAAWDADGYDTRPLREWDAGGRKGPKPPLKRRVNLPPTSLRGPSGRGVRGPSQPPPDINDTLDEGGGSTGVVDRFVKGAKSLVDPDAYYQAAVGAADIAANVPGELARDPRGAAEEMARGLPIVGRGYEAAERGAEGPKPDGQSWARPAAMLGSYVAAGLSRPPTAQQAQDARNNPHSGRAGALGGAIAAGVLGGPVAGALLPVADVAARGGSAGDVAESLGAGTASLAVGAAVAKGGQKLAKKYTAPTDAVDQSTGAIIKGTDPTLDAKTRPRKNVARLEDAGGRVGAAPLPNKKPPGVPRSDEAPEMLAEGAKTKLIGETGEGGEFAARRKALSKTFGEGADVILKKTGEVPWIPPERLASTRAFVKKALGERTLGGVDIDAETLSVLDRFDKGFEAAVVDRPRGGSPARARASAAAPPEFQVSESTRRSPIVDANARPIDVTETTTTKVPGRPPAGIPLEEAIAARKVLRDIAERLKGTEAGAEAKQISKQIMDAIPEDYRELSRYYAAEIDTLERISDALSGRLNPTVDGRASTLKNVAARLERHGRQGTREESTEVRRAAEELGPFDEGKAIAARAPKKADPNAATVSAKPTAPAGPGLTDDLRNIKAATAMNELKLWARPPDVRAGASGPRVAAPVNESALGARTYYPAVRNLGETFRSPLSPIPGKGAKAPFLLDPALAARMGEAAFLQQQRPDVKRSRDKRKGRTQ